MRKRNAVRLVALCLCLLLLPGTAGAASWGEFIMAANIAMQTATNPSDDVTISIAGGDTQIDSPSFGGPLTTNIGGFTGRLVLSGLTFKNGLWITSGNYGLVGVTVESNGIGIDIKQDSDGSTDVDLTLDETTTITSNASGIFAALGGDSASITIYNKGDITAGKVGPNGSNGIAIFAGAYVSDNVTVDITNEGNLTSTDANVVQVTTQSQNAAASSKVHNAGDGTLTALNLADGEVLPWASGAVTFALGTNAEAEIIHDSNGEIKAGGALYAMVSGEGAKAKVTHSSATDTGGGIQAKADGNGTQATVIHNGAGTVGSMITTTSGNNTRIVVENTGNGAVRGNEFGVSATAYGDIITIDVINTGAITGEQAGLQISAPSGGAVMVDNTGSIQGTGDFTLIAGQIYTGVDTNLKILKMDSAKTDEELLQEMISEAERMGLSPINGDSLLLWGRDEDGVDRVVYLLTSPPRKTPHSRRPSQRRNQPLNRFHHPRSTRPTGASVTAPTGCTSPSWGWPRGTCGFTNPPPTRTGIPHPQANRCFSKSCWARTGQVASP